MFGLGPLELIPILIIVILLFGVGRIGKIAKELGTGIRSFRDGIQGDPAKSEKEDKSSTTSSKEE